MSVAPELPIALLLASIAAAGLAPEHAAITAATRPGAPTRGPTPPPLAFVVSGTGEVVAHPERRTGECALHVRTLLADSAP